MGAGSAASKLLGAATFVAVAIDVNNYAKNTMKANTTNYKAQSLKNLGMDEIKQGSSSSVETAVRKGVLGIAMDEKVTKPFTNTSGYLQGAGTMVVNHALPLALAAGTFMGKGWFLSKTCGLGLLGYGAYFFAKEILKIGKTKE